MAEEVCRRKTCCKALAEWREHRLLLLLPQRGMPQQQRLLETS
jgi:hypothetical protein